MKSVLSVALLMALVSMPKESRADVSGFSVPAIRGLPESSLAGWEVFSSAKDSGNTPDLSGSTGDARLLQTTPAAILTGSGNIYNPGGPSSFVVSKATPVPIEQIVFQARTVAVELDYNSVVLLFDEGGARKSLTATRSGSTDAGGGFLSKWEWNLAGRDVTAFQITFAASGPHLSLDSATLDVSTEVIRLANIPVSLDRWMYPFNGSGGARPNASVFGALNSPGFDERDAQFLLGWNLDAQLPTGRGAANYIVQRASVGLTVSVSNPNNDPQWTYDGTFDDRRTYFLESDPRYVADADAGRPVELFGAGFRNGWTAETFLEGSPFKGSPTDDPPPSPFSPPYDKVRAVYAAGFNAAGELVDVSSNVGTDLETGFDSNPFAVGVVSGLNPGELVPPGTRLNFPIDVSNGLVAGYLGSSLNEGRLRFVATSLLTGSQGTANYPQFYNKENTLALPAEFPQLDLDVQIAKPSPTVQVSPGANGKLRLSWPAGDAKFQIEIAPAMSRNVNWQPVSATASEEGGMVTVEVDSAQNTGFFRLHRVL